MCVGSVSVSKNLLPNFAMRASERMCLVAVGHAKLFSLRRKISARTSLFRYVTMRVSVPVKMVVPAAALKSTACKVLIKAASYA